MTATTLQERVMIQELSQGGLPDRQVASQLSLSIHTARKWRRRGREQGKTGLLSKMGRPAKGAMSTYPLEVHTALRAWRTAHPGWGAKTLYAELEQYEAFQRKHIPSRAVITRWLKQAGLARRYEKHQALPAMCVSPTHACHEEWEMDARGHHRVPEVGVISLININDVFSKVKVMSYPCWLGDQRANRHPTTEDYQVVLRLAFTEWGVPDRLAVDHDSIYYDNSSKSPYPSRLHLWLVALGVNLTFGRMGQPRDQATTERSHQLWDHQVLEGQTFSSQEVLRHALSERRSFLNEHLPCASLGNVPPLQAHPEARLPRRPYRPEWETEQMDLSRVHAYLSQGRWFRKGSNVGSVSLGGQVYVLGRTPWARADIEITFDATDQHLVFRTPDGTQKRRPARGITATDLMGEMGALVHLNEFQLMLPLSYTEWLQLYYCHILSGTTL
jgi:transposase